MTRNAAVFALLCCLTATHLVGQDNTDQQPFKIRVTSDKVNVRSHASTTAGRVVLRVLQDTVLDAVAHEGDWYRILPPQDVFSYVSAGYVERNGNVGTVNVVSGSLRVRLGSVATPIDPARAEVQTRLRRGDKVEIVGQDGDWYQIRPPAGVHYFVSADHSKPLDASAAAELEANPPVRVSAPVVRSVEPTPVTPDKPLVTGGVPVVQGKPISDGSTPRLSDIPRSSTPVPVADTSRSSEPTLIASGDRDLESSASSTTPTVRKEEKNPIRRGPFGNPLPPPGTPMGSTSVTKPDAPAKNRTPSPTLAGSNNSTGASLPPPTTSGNTTSGNAATNGTSTSTQRPTVARQPVQTPSVASNQPTRPVTTPQQQIQPPPVQQQPVQQPVVRTPPKLERFLAEGILQPNFSLPMSNQGLRYELRHPFDRRRVVAYAEFGASVQANPTSLVGKYVGITGQTFLEPRSGKQIIRVSGVTAMPAPRWTPR